MMSDKRLLPSDMPRRHVHDIPLEEDERRVPIWIVVPGVIGAVLAGIALTVSMASLLGQAETRRIVDDLQREAIQPTLDSVAMVGTDTAMRVLNNSVDNLENTIDNLETKLAAVQTQNAEQATAFASALNATVTQSSVSSLPTNTPINRPTSIFFVTDTPIPTSDEPRVSSDRPTNTPRPTFTPSPPGTPMTVNAFAVVRSGPGTGYEPPIGRFDEDLEVRVLGQTLGYDSVNQGWVEVNLRDEDGNLLDGITLMRGDNPAETGYVWVGNVSDPDGLLDTAIPIILPEDLPAPPR